MRLNTLLDLLFFKASRDLEASSPYCQYLSFCTSLDHHGLHTPGGRRSLPLESSGTARLGQKSVVRSIGQGPSPHSLQADESSRSCIVPVVAKEGRQMNLTDESMKADTRGEDGGGASVSTALVADVFSSSPQRRRLSTKESVFSLETSAISSASQAARAVRVLEGRLPESILGWTFFLPGDPPSFVEKELQRTKEEGSAYVSQDQERNNIQPREFPEGQTRHDETATSGPRRASSASSAQQALSGLPCKGVPRPQEQAGSQGDVRTEEMVGESGSAEGERGTESFALCKEENKRLSPSEKADVKKRPTPLGGTEEMRASQNKWKYSDVFDLCLDAAICRDTLADK